MRVSLENKISYLADKWAVYKIWRDRVSDKYILIVESWPIEWSVFLSKSISKVVSLFIYYYYI